MSSDETAVLAAACGEALVQAMPTPAWPETRERALLVLRHAAVQPADVYASWLDESAEDLRGAEPGDQDERRRELVALWTRRLGRLLGERPSAADEVQALLSRIRTVLGAEGRAGKTMTNISRDHSTLFAVMDGSIHQHYAPPPGRPDEPDGDQR